jgi:hypothetical protein
MSVSMGITSLIVLFILAFLFLRKAWYLPLLEKQERERGRNLFYSCCPQKLLDVLRRNYMTPDGSFEKLTPDARRALEGAFSEKGVRVAMSVLSTGRAVITMFECDIASYFVPEKGRFQDLRVIFEFGELVSTKFSEPYHACTIPDW